MSSMYPSSGGSTSQRCQRCGVPLAPNQGYCNNCGLNNAAGQGQANTPPNRGQFSSLRTQGNNPQQPAQSPGQGQQSNGSGTQQWGQPFPSPQNNQFGSSSSLQQPSRQPLPPQQSFGASNSADGSNGFRSFHQTSRSNNSFAPPQSFQQSTPSSPTIFNGPQQGNRNAPDNFPPAQFNQLPKKKGGPRIGRLIAILLIILVLIGGGVAGYVVLKGNSPSKRTQTTDSTQAPTPHGNALFSDTFSDNSKGWDLTGSPGQFSVKVGNGSLILEDDAHRLLPELVPGGKQFGNFLLNVDVTLSKGTQDNGYGIYIRASSNGVDITSYYRFELYGDGTYAIFKGSTDSTGTLKNTMMANFTISSAIKKQGQLNHLSLSASGSTLSLMVNGQTVKTITDTSYKSGSIALFVSDLSTAPAGAQATFSNLAIYPPQ